MTIFVAERSPWLAPELLRDGPSSVKGSSIDFGGAAYAWRRAWCEDLLERKAFSARGLHLGLFGLLGIRPTLAERFKKRICHSCGDCAVLSDAVWRSQFHRDGNVIGRSLFLDSDQVQIVGVLPAAFAGSRHREIGGVQSVWDGLASTTAMYEWPGALLRAPTA